MSITILILPKPSLAGAAYAFLYTEHFVSQQLGPTAVVETLSPTQTLVTHQLGNTYVLLMFLAVGIIHATTEQAVVRNYLFSVMLCDFGHVFVCYRAMGYDKFVDVWNWNPLTWGNVGISVCYFFLRGSYLIGLWDRPGAAVQRKKSSSKSE
ncbi:hypothetical protein NQ176_g543 [Zarea fungicola]|uniref:Uncharacterized protein n=1 Tax=Zarea fungicola TaxID=93591 RepID=A0ACC1NWH6_9HYPO|nr:hypothetical protein NQ176_g543 [Lecanicillium fungicola]